MQENNEDEFPPERNGDTTEKFAMSGKDSVSNLKMWQVIFGRLPKILLNGGFTVLSAVFAFSVAATPVLSIGGFVLVLVFAGRAVDEAVRIFANSKYKFVTDKYGDQEDDKGSIEIIEESNKEEKSDGKNENEENDKEKTIVKINKDKKMKNVMKEPGFWKFLSYLLLGIGLILFGVALFTMPASFLGALAGLGTFAKVSAIVTGIAFLAKGLIDYEKPDSKAPVEKSQTSGETSKRISGVKARWSRVQPILVIVSKLYVRNVLDFLLYGACAGLGIVGMLTGGFGVVPLVFTSVFAMYAVASMLNMFGADGPEMGLLGKAKAPRLLESLALGIMGLTLLVGGIAFAPALLGTFGLTATLSAQIMSIFMGAVLVWAAVSKIWFGGRLKFLDLRSGGVLQQGETWESINQNYIEQKTLNVFKPKLKLQDSFTVSQEEY